MVKKINRSGDGAADGTTRKALQSKRLRLKSLHRSVQEDRQTLDELSPDRLPPASSSNAARQARSKLNNTFPVDWQDLHMTRHAESKRDSEDAADDSE